MLISFHSNISFTNIITQTNVKICNFRDTEVLFEVDETLVEV